MTSKEFYEKARGKKVRKIHDSDRSLYDVVGYLSGFNEDIVLISSDIGSYTWRYLRGAIIPGYVSNFPDGELSDGCLVSTRRIGYLEIVNQEDDYGYIIMTKVASRVFPHKCKSCNSPCLHLFSSVECSNRHCDNYAP